MTHSSLGPPPQETMITVLRAINLAGLVIAATIAALGGFYGTGFILLGGAAGVGMTLLIAVAFELRREHQETLAQLRSTLQDTPPADPVDRRRP